VRDPRGNRRLPDSRSPGDDHNGLMAEFRHPVLAI
jgi:hypothetical protein